MADANNAREQCNQSRAPANRSGGREEEEPKKTLSVGHPMAWV